MSATVLSIIEAKDIDDDGCPIRSGHALLF